MVAGSCCFLGQAVEEAGHRSQLWPAALSLTDRPGRSHWVSWDLAFSPL